MRRRCLLALAAFVLLVQACRSKPSPGRLIVLGLDGMDPEVVDLLMSEGKLPTSPGSGGRARTAG